MVSYLRGEICLLLLLLSISLLSEHPLAHECNCETDEAAPPGLYQHQQAQIDRLEQLVKNLSEIVAKLESNQQRSSKVEKFGSTRDFKRKGGGDVEGSKYDEGRVGRDEAETEGFMGDRSAGGMKSKMAAVTKYNPFWSERFRFVSAVNLDSVAMSINVFPFHDSEGFSKYVGVGDDRGRVYVFTRNGDVVVEFVTPSDSPITAMMSYASVYRNESILVTGHKNGAIFLHRIWESPATAEASSSLHVESTATCDSVEPEEDGYPITILEIHHAGRLRYILSADANGRVKVFKENGALYGLAVPTSHPLAFLRQRLLFLTETGAGSLDLRTMKIREAECEGLNHSLVKNYVFDAVERSKAYGITTAGDLVHVLLLGDTMNFKCRVRFSKKTVLEEPVAFQAIKGYLLVADQEKVYVYNVSSQHYSRSGSLRLAFSAGIEEIKASFMNYQLNDVDKTKKSLVPLMTCDHENLVVLGLGGGYVGMYQSKLPVSRGESNSILLSSPVLFFILFLFVAWQFFAKKKEALTSWETDDPFTSTSVNSGAPLGSGAGDISFSDLSSRSVDTMNLRSDGFRGTSRRYASPTRYPVGGADSFRPNSVDSGSGPSIDPEFRASCELKFRGSNLESSGFAQRRENMYANNKVLDDNS